MATGSETEGRTRHFQLGRAEPLNKAERIALIVVVTGSALLDLIQFLAAPDIDPGVAVLSILISLTFAIYIWSPLAASCALGVAVLLAFLAEHTVIGLVAASIAAGLVLRSGAAPLVFGYLGGLLVTTGLFAYAYRDDRDTPGNIALSLILAAISGGVGLALRMAYARGHLLEKELRDREEHERQAVLAERRWIAGELHDSIAHHLTVVALHVQMLDDEHLRPGSQEAIRTAARKALSDLRFVIELAEDGPRGDGVPAGDLAAAVDEARSEFESTGHAVVCEGDPSDERIPRGAEIILTRIVRESATNILKYAGPGEIRFEFGIDDESVSLTIRSPLPNTPRRDLPSTGTGLNRMAERVLGVRGEFTAGPDGGAWKVFSRLPTM